MLLLLLLLTGPSQAQSALDGFDPNANGTVRVVVVQPDGKILIGGDFTTLSPNGGATVTRNHIARLNPDGTLDTAFNPNANDDCPFNRGAGGRQDFGGRLFQRRIGGQTRNHIARLDATTGLADSFDPNANDAVSFNRGAGGRQDFGGRLFHRASADRRATASPGSMPRPVWLIRSTRTRTAQCRFNRGAGGRQDSGGRRFLERQHRRTAAQPHRPARCHDRPGGFVRPERERCMSLPSRCRRTARFWWAAFHSRSIGGQPRNIIARLDATTGLADSFNPNANACGPFNRGAGGRQDSGGRLVHESSADSRAIASPGSIPPPAWLIRSIRTRTRCVSLQSRCRRTAKFWRAAISPRSRQMAERP